MPTYKIVTDSFAVDIDAANVNDAIEEAFDGEMHRPPTSLAELDSRFAEIGDGARYRITCDVTGEEYQGQY